MLGFFDDILIYSKTLKDHLKHLEEVLSNTEAQSLHTKACKCEFGMMKILYMEHIISDQGIHVHQKRIQAIIDWPSSRTPTELRGFFGLCNYYKRFVNGFLQLGAPLTKLTKKGAFRWTSEAQRAFDKLKEVMRTCPMTEKGDVVKTLGALLAMSSPFLESNL